MRSFFWKRCSDTNPLVPCSQPESCARTVGDGDSASRRATAGGSGLGAAVQPLGKAAPSDCRRIPEQCVGLGSSQRHTLWGLNPNVRPVLLMKQTLVSPVCLEYFVARIIVYTWIFWCCISRSDWKSQ